MKKTPRHSLALRIYDTVNNVPKSTLWSGIVIGFLTNIGLLIVVLLLWNSPYGYLATKMQTDPEFKATWVELVEQGKSSASSHNQGQ